MRRRDATTTDETAHLEIGLLGHVTAVRDGVPVDLGGVRGQTLLALLALRAGSPVRADQLIDQLWAQEAPAGAETTLRSYVSRLRAALGSDTAIDREALGYTLRIPRDAVDIVRFEALIRAGRDLLARSRHRRAADSIERALALWRGTPFTGLPEEGVLRVEATRLEELRLHAYELRFEADLERGRDAELVDELEALLVAHPFRERLWRHLMLALYRAGRQADALAAYHRARTALDEQLGIEPSEELRALEAAILRQEVPGPAKSAQAPIGLAVSLTSFVGRTTEVREVQALLRRARLLTLVGVGGVGKTRLAVEAAARALDDDVDQVAFVDLAAISDPALLPGLVADALGVRDAAERELGAAIHERLSGTDSLLILDNCEHLREAAAALAQSILAAAADLRILATSRVVLDVAGEALYPVPPLTLPDARDGLAAARESEAVQLLVERAALTRHDLRIDDAAYRAAARICSAVDGLPLAIELAAARSKALSLDEIADRLRDRFEFLVAWRRLTEARHRTLREAMDWSFELLEPEEQRLLARLSVFPAGATLASIAEVCQEGDLETAERLVERLVDASLVGPIQTARGGTRYRLLETVREYGAERLAAEDSAQLERRHAARMLVISRATGLALESVGAGSDFELAREELPSIRAAIRWATANDPDIGLEIACSLERFWVTNATREGLAIFDALLAQPVPEGLRARGCRCRGGCRYYLGDFDGGASDYEAALEIHRRLGQRAHEAHLLMRLAIEAHRTGDPERARELLGRADAVGGADRFVPDTYVGLGLAADLAFAAGREDEAFEMLHNAVDLSARAGDDWWQSDALLQLAGHALDFGRLDDGGRAAGAALPLARRIEDRQTLVWGLALLARYTALSGRPHEAGRIWGAIEAEVERGEPLGQWALEREALRANVSGPGGAAFEAAVAEGRSLSIEAVVDAAFDDPDRRLG